MKNRLKGNKSKRQPKVGNGHKDPPKITGPWGRAASEYRPGKLIKRYLIKHEEGCAADVFTALKEELKQLNQERVEIGEKPIRGCTYNSFAKYWHWFAILGLIERTDRSEPSIYPFLRKRIFYRMTDKGKAEIRSWEDPISVAHPEFR
jgi:hypothetical protein